MHIKAVAVIKDAAGVQEQPGSFDRDIHRPHSAPRAVQVQSGELGACDQLVQHTVDEVRQVDDYGVKEGVFLLGNCVFMHRIATTCRGRMSILCIKWV